MNTRRKLTKAEKTNFKLMLQGMEAEKAIREQQGAGVVIKDFGIPAEINLDKGIKRLRQIIKDGK